MNERWRTLLLALALCLLWWGMALACDQTTFYLDPASGNDAGACTEQAPCRSAAKLQTLLNTAKPGHQILLKRGTTLVVTSKLRLDTVSGTEGKPITLGAYGEDGAAHPILDASGMGGGVMAIGCQEQGYWVIQDLHIQGNKGAIDYVGCHHQTFQRNTISRCGQECLHVKHALPSPPSSHITIKNNVINAPNRAESIYLGTDVDKGEGVFDTTHDILIEGNEITGGASHECIEAKEGSQRVTIKNNHIHDNVITQNGCIFSSRKDPAAPPGNHVIENNVITNITGEDGYGIRVRNDSVIKNNDISNTSQMGIFLESLDGYPTYKRTISVKTSTK